MAMLEIGEEMEKVRIRPFLAHSEKFPKHKRFTCLANPTQNKKKKTKGGGGGRKRKKNIFYIISNDTSIVLPKHQIKIILHKHRCL